MYPIESSPKVRTAFKQLCSAVCPATVDTNMKLMTRIEESGWLQLIQELLYHTRNFVDLMHEDGSSVVLCLEEGWDVTCQLSALVQLCLDPHYRSVRCLSMIFFCERFSLSEVRSTIPAAAASTVKLAEWASLRVDLRIQFECFPSYRKIDGFCTLIEKEWLAFGHRFALRGNISQQSSAFTPIFLQFLDCVHQLLNQVRFLAYKPGEKDAQRKFDGPSKWPDSLFKI